MRTVLHIGAAKTGTTALQKALNGAREALLDAGVLYPTCVGESLGGAQLTKHAYLAASLRVELPRELENYQSRDPDLYELRIQEQVRMVKAEIEKHHPEVLVISAEEFFSSIDRTRATRALRWIFAVSDQLTVVAYVRRPSDSYLSHVQQTLFASHILPAFRYDVRLPLQMWARICPSSLIVRGYRENTVGDFVRTFVPEAQSIVDSSQARANVTLSAEAMALLQEFRHRHFPFQPDRFNKATQDLVELLRKADTSVPGATRPRLTESIRSAIDRSASDVSWLRSVHGVTFNGFDYASASGDAPPKISDVRDICRIDEARLTALRTKVEGGSVRAVK